jgi:hypothetical protein
MRGAFWIQGLISQDRNMPRSARSFLIYLMPSERLTPVGLKTPKSRDKPQFKSVWMAMRTAIGPVA